MLNRFDGTLAQGFLLGVKSQVFYSIQPRRRLSDCLGRFSVKQLHEHNLSERLHRCTVADFGTPYCSGQVRRDAANGGIVEDKHDQAAGLGETGLSPILGRVG